MWMIALIVGGACSTPVASGSDEPVEVVVETIFGEFREALKHASDGEVDASHERYDRAMIQFEDRIEPALKEVCGQRCTTAIEYDLGRFRAQLSVSDEQAGAILDDLDKRVISILN